MPTFAIDSADKGYKVAFGRHTTAAAVDTIATGLSIILAAVASYETDPADANSYVSAVPGVTAGTVVIKTWKTSGTDPTPVAADAFSKVVNWIAIGY